jgi:AcrR family transcriptional regulator
MSTPERGLRSDAQRNRERIIEAARDVFASKGLDAPLDEIARAAGVSPATPYHRFSSREGLIEAVLLQQMDAAVAIAKEALAHDDPWLGLHQVIREMVAFHTADRGFCQACADRGFAVNSKTAERESQYKRLLDRIIKRAKSARVVRRDFSVDDVCSLIIGAAYAVRSAQLHTSLDRQIELILNGIHA